MMSSKVVGAGAFVVIGVGLFTAALFMIGERRLLFTKRFPVYTEFSQLGQLEVGAIVRVAGLDAGEVSEIAIPSTPSGKFRVRMDIREDVQQLVRNDSVATSQTEGLVGAIYVHIAAGSEQAPQITSGGTIRGRDPFSMADLLQQASEAVTLVTTTVESLRGDAETAVQQIALTAGDAHILLEDIGPQLTAIARHGNQIAADTQQIMTNINQGKGTVGKLVKDDTLYKQAAEIATQTKMVMENVQQISADARRTIADLRAQSGPAQGMMAGMRVTLDQAREATADLADNMEAMKHNFLLRGFFNQRGYFDLDAISPAEYRKGVLENGKRKAMRIWLGSDVLFERGTNENETLTADGRVRLDSAMATFLKYLPANPLVIEGYGTDGTESDRYQRAKARAGIVRAYLLSRYDLTAQSVGSIALTDAAVGSPAGNRWDGVALVLFLDRRVLQLANEAQPK